MPQLLNIDDADDVFLSAKAEVDEIIDELFEEWFAPDAELVLIQTMKAIPPEVQEVLKQLEPEAYKNVTDAIDRITRGKNG